MPEETLYFCGIWNEIAAEAEHAHAADRLRRENRGEFTGCGFALAALMGVALGPLSTLLLCTKQRKVLQCSEKSRFDVLDLSERYTDV
jgi:hypothetical protein